MKKFSCLALCLLATSAMMPAMNAMEENERVPQRIFQYDAQPAEKEVYFKFKSLFDSVKASVGKKLEELQEYLTWKQREGNVPLMLEGFRLASEKAMTTLDTELSKVPSLDRERVLRLFDALVNRELRIYEGLFAQADKVIGFINSFSLPTYIPGNSAYYNGYSISISADSGRQFDYLTLGSFIQSESERLGALNPSLINTNQAYWSLLAYLTNTGAVQCGNGECKPVRQEVLDVFHAYGQGVDPRAAEYKFLEIIGEEENYSHKVAQRFDITEARRIATMMASGKQVPPCNPQLGVIRRADILAAARTRGGFDVPIVHYVPDVVEPLIQAAAKMGVNDKEAAGGGVEEKSVSSSSAAAGKEIIQVTAIEEKPVPVLIPAFTAGDIEQLARINTTLETIQAAQTVAYKRGEKFGGYSEAEQIIAYGSDSVISTRLRSDVETLLMGQLAKRAIRPESILQVRKTGFNSGYEAAASYLADWIRTKARTSGLSVDVEGVVSGMQYTKMKAATHKSSNDQILFNTLWALRSLDVKYDTLLTASAEDQAKKAEIESLLMQSFNMIDEHNIRCATGAKGRNFLMQMAMLSFFKDYDPTILVP